MDMTRRYVNLYGNDISRDFDKLNAKAKGKSIGRPKTAKEDIPAIFYKHYPAYAAKTLNISEFARVCGLSRPTVYKYLSILEVSISPD